MTSLLAFSNTANGTDYDRGPFGSSTIPSMGRWYLNNATTCHHMYTCIGHILNMVPWVLIFMTQGTGIKSQNLVPTEINPLYLPFDLPKDIRWILAGFELLGSLWKSTSTRWAFFLPYVDQNPTTLTASCWRWL